MPVKSQSLCLPVLRLVSMIGQAELMTGGKANVSFLIITAPVNQARY